LSALGLETDIRFSVFENSFVAMRLFVIVDTVKREN